MTTMPKNKKPISKKTFEYSDYIEKVSADQIDEIFTYWVEMFQGVSGKAWKLNNTRRAHIAWGIHTYGVERCKKAIFGCASSPFHMGDNKLGKTYNSLELIFRSMEHTNRFLRIAADNE